MGIKFPTPWKTLIIKFPPPQDGKGVKCPGYARGGMLKLRFDRYIKQRSPSVIAALKLAIKDEIAAACQTLCRRSDGSVLYSNRNSFENLKEFDFDRVWTEMKSNVPFFIEIMNAVSGKNLGMENTELDVRVKFCFLYSVLMNERWHELSLLKRVNTILIIEGGCTKKVCTVFV